MQTLPLVDGLFSKTSPQHQRVPGWFRLPQCPEEYLAKQQASTEPVSIGAGSRLDIWVYHGIPIIEGLFTLCQFNIAMEKHHSQGARHLQIGKAHIFHAWLIA